MSTSYYINTPTDLDNVRLLTGWRPWADENGEGLTDGKNYVHAYEMAWNNNTYVCLERFGANEVDILLELLRQSGLPVVSEHDDAYNPPWAEALDALDNYEL